MSAKSFQQHNLLSAQLVRATSLKLYAAPSQPLGESPQEVAPNLFGGKVQREEGGQPLPPASPQGVQMLGLAAWWEKA